MPQMLKKRTKAAKKAAVTHKLVKEFDVANAKDKDFDLDMDAASFRGAKGQSGTRFKGKAPTR